MSGIDQQSSGDASLFIMECRRFRAKLNCSLGRLSMFCNQIFQRSSSWSSMRTGGDGSSLDVPKETKLLVKVIDDIIRDIGYLNLNSIRTLFESQIYSFTHNLIDDKTYFMERLIQTASSFPKDSFIGKRITGKFIKQLWSDLEHPPPVSLDSKWQFRSPDGSNNSLLFPDLGKAGSAYARSVPPSILRPILRPPPELIFDCLVRRKYRDKHPNRISSIMFYFASIITHDLFRTDHHDFRISNTSSYLDLSPLYGSNEDEQKSIRTFTNGRIHRDSFAEKRLFLLPPGVSVLLIMFNRFHNFVVENLALINEDNRFDVNSPTRDEDLFQTGRLITCGLYINIILVDYVRTLLNLNKTNSSWKLDPRVSIPNLDRVYGNQVSVEFNLIYRWHSTLSERDEEWTNRQFDQMFPDKKQQVDQLKWQDFVDHVRQAESSTIWSSSSKSFPLTICPNALSLPDKCISREIDLDNSTNKCSSTSPVVVDTVGSFPDDELVKILVESIEDCAHAFGAQRVPAVLKAVEILGMQQARSWNVATLNEFRVHFGLTPHKTFESINSNPYVADTLKRLYDRPEFVELYPGLLVEEPKVSKTPGAGLTPSFTVSRAILSDAVTLVRGDRFYTVDYHPGKLTQWGYNLVNSNLEVDHGCCFHTLISTAFPDHFNYDSIHAHYPMTIPQEMETVVEKLGRSHLYSFDIPTRRSSPNISIITSFSAMQKVLSDDQTFSVSSTSQVHRILDIPHFDLLTDSDGLKKSPLWILIHDTIYPTGWEDRYKVYFLQTTQKLLSEKSYQLSNSFYIDIIRDLAYFVPLQFITDYFNLPIKSCTNPTANSPYTDYDLLQMITDIYMFVYVHGDTTHRYLRMCRARKSAKLLNSLILSTLKHLDCHRLLNRVFSVSSNSLNHFPNSPHISIIRQYLKSHPQNIHLVSYIIFTVITYIVISVGQTFAKILEFFLTHPNGSRHFSRVQLFASDPSSNSWDTLMHYALEASRFNSDRSILRCVAIDTTLRDADQLLVLHKGDEILLNLPTALNDSVGFPDPRSLNLSRPIDRYSFLGSGLPFSLAFPLLRVAITSMLKVVSTLPNLRIPDGIPHTINRISCFDNSTFPLNLPTPASLNHHKSASSIHANLSNFVYLSEKLDSYLPYPASLKVCWNARVSSEAADQFRKLHSTGEPDEKILP